MQQQLRPACLPRGSQQFHVLCQCPVLPEQLLWNTRMHKALVSWTFSLWSPAHPLPCLQCGTAKAVLLQAPRVCRCSLAQPSLVPGLPGTACCAPAALAWQHVPQPANSGLSKWPGALPEPHSWREADWDHTRLCESLGRDHPPPGRAGEPPEPPTPWPPWSPTVSKPDFGKGCSSLFFAVMGCGYGFAEGAELFSLPEVS